MAARHSGLQNKHFLDRLWIFTTCTPYNPQYTCSLHCFQNRFRCARQHRLRRKFWVCDTIAAVRSL